MFFARMQEGDHVLAADGQTILGIGRVVGPYEHLAGKHFPHARTVEWRSTTAFKSPDRTGLMTTVYPMDGHWAPLLAAVAQLTPRAKDPQPGPMPHTPLPPLTGTLATIDEELRRKGQLVLYGPPGTGKTWHAWRAVEELAARGTFGRAWSSLSATEKADLIGRGAPAAQRVWACTFHPSFGYEEFVEGLRPEPRADGQLSFRVQPGLFRRVCAAAEKANGQPCFLIIDELNRGDAARIFGELLTLIELDKRGRAPVELPCSHDSFVVPRNVFLIATMNTADRSIALLDAALRRRFGFHELLPDPSLLQGAYAGNVHLGALLQALNGRIRKHLSRDARNLQVGHSYFQRDGSPLSDFADLRRALRHEVLPLLQEYCYDEPEALRQIVGERLIDPKTREIRADLFAAGEKVDELCTALAEWDASIVRDEVRLDESDEVEPGEGATGG
jgi:5-methylcytosine-specific restriction protein B